MVSAVQVLGKVPTGCEWIVSPEAIEFSANIAREFEPTRRSLLSARAQRQAEMDAGATPDFLPETRSIRQHAWKVQPPPADLLDRRVEITGPASDRKMVINALNSGAQVYMSDFEDSLSPSWQQLIEGQRNIHDAINRTISFKNPDGAEYRLKDKTAVLAVRPRGLHLTERHIYVDGQPIAASFFDFSLAFYHNARNLVKRGSGPYFYLPKMQSHLEARLWNDVFEFAQDRLGVPRGTIKATVLIEHILASFEMEEILYALKDHIVGLNLGRWDYIYSYIKVFKRRHDGVLPDRAQVTMATHFMQSAAELLVQTCHKRGAHAMGGMSAFIPRKDDPTAAERVLAQITADKEREASQGFDGAWVAHPGLVPVVQQVFAKSFKGPNQLHHYPEVQVTARDLLEAPKGEITRAGVCNNIGTALQYLESWVQGRGAVAINGLMEDTATAEISRAQLWQWIHNGSHLNTGEPVTQSMYIELRTEQLERLVRERTQPGALDRAVELLDSLVLNDSFEEFLAIPGYRYLE